MGLFSASVTQKINQIAAKSTEQPKSVSNVNTRSMNDELNQISKQVIDYFQDSQAILITTKEQLHDYVDKCIENGYAGIDTETTGLDRINDWIVGASLYTPGMPECYIPMKHIVPIFDNLYKDQLTYEEVGEELRRFTEPKQVLSDECKVKLIFANADFDLAMIYKDLKADLINAFYYDVITAWRCLKEDEMDNSLKGLYAKYVKKGKIDPKKFSDFFPVKLFPNCKPKVAALYAANDAKITYELFIWQLPYVTVTHEKCQKNHLEKIANLVWNIEFPMVRVCAMLHRRGVYLDDSIASVLHDRYTGHLNKDKDVLAEEVQKLIDDKDVAANMKRPFRTGKDFNPNSNPHVKYLINNLLGSQAKTTGKDVLKELNKPSTKAVLDVRGDVKLLSTYVDKLPKATAQDKRIHASFKSIGADTGRMCLKAGTLVDTPNGSIEIENLKPGQKVFCYNLSSSLVVESKVEDVLLTGKDRECITIECDGGEHITCTPDHPFLTENNQWVEAINLKEGSTLIHLYFSYDIDFGDHFPHHNTRKVVKISKCTEHYDVYDIVVEKYHNFFAEGICLHNSSEAPNMQNIPSHALDIRHMFRATPEQIEIIKLAKDENLETRITLSWYDKVPTLEGLKEVKELQENDKLVMHEDKIKTMYSILSIAKQNGQSTIVLKKGQ